MSTRSVEKQALAKEYLANFGKNALLKAACRGDEELCRQLVPRCAVNFRDKRGGTALMYAALNGSEVVCELLLNAQAHIDNKCNDGWTPQLPKAIHKCTVDWLCVVPKQILEMLMD